MPIKYKVIAAALVVLAASAHLLNSGYRDWNSGGDSAYVMLLGFLLFSKEKREDERVKQLKLWAITVGAGIGYVFTVAAKLTLNLMKVRLPDGADFPRGLSAFDFMFVALVAATCCFHFWRVQDGHAAQSSAR